MFNSEIRDSDLTDVSEEALSLVAELSCGHGVTLHIQQRVEKQCGGLGNHMIGVLLWQ